MRGYTQLGFCFVLLFLGLGTGGPFQGLLGQQTVRELDRTQFGIGYIVNAPDQMAGIGGYVVFQKWGGIGLYVDYKWDLSNPADDDGFEEGLTAEEVPYEVSGAYFLGKESSYQGLNFALVRPVNSFLMLYGGAGLARRTEYYAYEDPSTNLGQLGAFQVESTAESGDFVNVLFGIMMRVGPRVTSHFGFETQPKGVTAGLSLRLPRW